MTSTYRSQMQKRLERPFKKDEVVHHIDGNRNNNNENNLAIMTRSAHARLHARERKLKEIVKKKTNNISLKPIDHTQLSRKHGWRYLSGCDIKYIREQLGLTRNEVAYYAGVSPSAIYRTEKHPDKFLSMSSLKRIQLVFENAIVEWKKIGPEIPLHIVEMLGAFDWSSRSRARD